MVYTYSMRNGYFGVGVYHPKYGVNIGTLMRSASAFGANFIYTVGRRYKRQASDTVAASNHIPCYHYLTLDDLLANLPVGCRLVGIELAGGSLPLNKYKHPQQVCYLLGAEDHGLPPEVMARCHELIEIPGADACLNVATAGSIVMYDRKVRQGK